MKPGKRPMTRPARSCRRGSVPVEAEAPICFTDASERGGVRASSRAARTRAPRSDARLRLGDERGDFAIFIAVIASALLLFGSIAYDAPRLITARQHASHTATEAAKVAAATVAAGGTTCLAGSFADLNSKLARNPYGCQADEAARRSIDGKRPKYGAPSEFAGLRCSGTWVEVRVETYYQNRSALAVFRDRQPIVAVGAAEAVLVGPDGQPEPLGYLPECPLPAVP